jgi:hypothetical protein
MSSPRLPASRRAGTRPRTDRAEQEHLAPAEAVGELAAEQQEAAEGERVAGDDPRQVVLAGDVEGAGDVGQRDVHDRRVEHDHELADREHEQGHALVHLATVGVQGPDRGPGAVVVTRRAPSAVFGSTTVDR